jgi:hypothetical protein
VAEALELAQSNDEKRARGVSWIFLVIVLDKTEKSHYSQAEQGGLCCKEATVEKERG